MHTPRRPGVVDGPDTLAGHAPALLTATAVLAYWDLRSRFGVPGQWDGRTVAQWLGTVPGRRARRLLEVLVTVSTCADPDRLALGAFGDLIRYQGGLATMLATAGGAQESLVVEGAGTLALRLAEQLGPRVRTGSRVLAIHRDERGVTLRTSTGAVRAARVVVTVPPPVAARIEHEPPLPAARARLERRTHMGSVYKAIAVYHRPFWRDRGRAAELVLLGEPGGGCFDTSPPGGPGHLCVLVGGPAARALDGLDDRERRTVVLGPLAPHLGPEVLDPVSWHEKSWHLDEHVGGGYAALPNPGDRAGHFPVACAPVGLLHWAGTETASEHAGYVEGAIEFGERAAREVREALAAGRPAVRPPRID